MTDAPSTHPVPPIPLVPAAMLYALTVAHAEIDRLRSLTRFQDGVIRSGDTACLTQAEREAVGRAARIAESCEAMEELTADDADALHGLLERMGGE